MNTGLYYKIYLQTYVSVTSYLAAPDVPVRVFLPEDEINEAEGNPGAALAAVSMGNYDARLGNETLTLDDFVREFEKRVAND